MSGNSGLERGIERELAGLADAVEVGPAPLAEVLAGGRRRLRRRRAALGGAALMTLGVLAGGVLVGAGHLPAGPAGGGPAGQAVVGGTSSPSRSASPSAVVAGDPFTPVRALLAQGTADGKQWQAWAALWPAGTRDQAWHQAELIWQEGHAAGSNHEEPTEAFAREYWHADADKVNVYVVVDGHRKPVDQVLETPNRHDQSPHGGMGMWGASVDVYQRAGLGTGGKDGPGAPDNGLGSAGPEFAGIAQRVAKVVIAYPDGTTAEAPLVTLADSPIRWTAFSLTDHSRGSVVSFYDAQGQLLSTDSDLL